MDILIKNIGELPEDGDLTLTITPKGQVILGGCIFTSNFGKEVKAVELPSHGRLGDLDKLAEEFDGHGVFMEEEVKKIIDFFPVVVEASNGTDN